MIAGILIIAFSLALLFYWFRYSCVLLLRNAKENAVPVVDESRFHIGEVQAQLRSETQLDPLHASLERDYAMLVYLVEHAAGLKLSSIEDRMLVLDYRVMRWCYRFTKLVAPDKSRQALSEMATVLGILAGRIEKPPLHGQT